MTNAEKIIKIEKYQSCEHVHELTCIHSNHSPLIPVEKGDLVILLCTTCGYFQTEIPEFVFKISDEYLTKHPVSYLNDKFGK